MLFRSSERWSDELLDDLRTQGDPLADRTVAAMVEDGEIDDVSRTFQRLDVNDDATARAAKALGCSYEYIEIDNPA